MEILLFFEHLFNSYVLCIDKYLKAMGLLKTALIGAAVYGAIKYVTKKDVNGKSVIDDLQEKAPEWMDKAKRFKEDLELKYKPGTTDPYVEVKP